MSLKNLTPIAVFGCLAGIIVFSWFRHGFLYGGGDVGLTTYNPQRISQIISKVWWEETAPGFPRPQGLASLPAELALSVLQNFGFGPVAIQAFLFAFILFAMGLGMYFLTLEMGGNNKKLAYLAAIFYLVNPYMMVQVWHRFIHSTFFLAAALPYLLLFWKRWIEGGRLINLILFLLTNFIFSFMFSTLAYVITIWALLFYFVLFEAFIPFKGKRTLAKISAKFLLGLIFWVLTNVWWIMPVLLISPSLLSAQHSIISSILTLEAISKQAVIPYSVAGLNPFYLFYNAELGRIFQNPLFLAIPMLSLGIVLTGIFTSVKQRLFIFFTGLFILAVFFAKGIAMPFGAPFLLGFTKSFVIGILRNPFEKMGILIPFSASILFAAGFLSVWNFFTRRKLIVDKGILVLLLIAVIGIYHWPFWFGKLFGTVNKPSFVEIPGYYAQANDWITNQRKAGNILHLPVVTGEGLTYKWQYGYSGVDATTDFFTSNPSISMGFNLFHIDNALSSLALITDISAEDEAKLKSLLKAFNVKFLVLRNDIDWQRSNTSDPAKVAARLEGLSFIEKGPVYGALSLYELKEGDYLGKFYTADKTDYVSGINGDNPLFKSAYLWYARSDADKVLIWDDKALNEEKAGSIVVLPRKTFTYSNGNELKPGDAVKILASIRFLPVSPFYPLIRLKENLKLFEITNAFSNEELVFAGKRLAEAYGLLQQKSQSRVSPQIADYIKLIRPAMQKIDVSTKFTADKKEVPLTIREILAAHESVLKFLQKNVLSDEADISSEALNLLKNFQLEQGISVLYEQKDGTSRVFRYEVPVRGEYEFLIAYSDKEKLYKERLSGMEFSINGRLEKRKGNINSSFISYGFANLDKGQYEISYPKFASENLFKGLTGGTEEYELSSGSKEAKIIEFFAQPFKAGGAYEFTFDFMVKKGNDPVVRVITDSGVSEERIREDLYNKQWREFKLKLDAKENSTKLGFRIEAQPWNDCFRQLQANSKLCQNPAIRESYGRPTQILIKNIKIQRIFDESLFLRLKEEATSSSSIANVSYSRPKPLFYKGSFHAGGPAYFVFSETFDRGWNLTLSNGEEILKAEHVLANMYANAWRIEKAGDYEFELEYWPQQYFNKGIKTGLGVFSILIIISLIWHIKGRRK